MKQKRYRAAGLALLLLLALLPGCGSQGQTAGSQENQDGYVVYYLNQAETSLGTVGYEPGAAEPDALVEEFLEQLSVAPADTDLKEVLTQDIAVSRYELEDGLLSLHFGIAYQTLDSVKEILVRMAVVRTLCQIPEVENVSFLIGDNPLMDSKKTPVGPVNADSFVENPGGAEGDYTTATATLYFANADGDKLVQEIVDISYSSSISMERVVVEQLIKGPLTDDAYPAIPPDTKLISVSTKDGICYVNLDNGFLKQGYDVTEAVPIYSIVNSLTAIPGISKVQILINGETNLVFRESIRFDTIFERNLDIVEEE